MAAAGTADRMEILSRAKKLHPCFLEDRRSVYWIDKWPPRPGPDGTTAFTCNDWVSALSKHKGYGIYRDNFRSTPMWPVSEGAKNAEATPRLQELARHRPVHDDYKYLRSVYTEVSDQSKNAEAGPRLEYLAEPKPHKVWANSNDTLRDGEFNQPITFVPPAALGFGGTPRIESLAEAKTTHVKFQPERCVQWPVSRNAMNTQASNRLQQLARPKSGRMKKDDYDPYKVPLGARNARPTPRINELCVPLERKVRQKKA